MFRKTVSGVMLTSLIISTLTLAFNMSLVRAVADPTISGTVRDKQGNPIPGVLIVAQDVSTEIDVASATSNAAGAYAMTVPPSTYNLIVTPPHESGFAPTTISNIEVTKDTVIDIVLVPAETIAFGGLVVDRDGNPVPYISVYLYSADIWKYAPTDEHGLFSMHVSPGTYNLRLSGGFGLAIADLYKSSSLNLTENTFITITLQNRYLSGKVIGPEGNPIPDVSIFMRGSTSFDDFNGYFDRWTTSDSNGNFNVTIYSSSGVSIRASPPPESPFAPVSITNVNVTEDASITIMLPHAVAFGGLVVDRDGNPVPYISVYLYSADIWRLASTNETGAFTMFVSPGSYNLRISGGFGLAIADLYKATALNLTQDTFITITLQNRYFSGKVVDPEGHPVPNVSIFMRGSTTFDDFNGYFDKWSATDSEGNFNVTIYTSSSVSLRATPPPESIYAPISIANIDVTDDKTVLIALSYRAGVLPTANFTWNPETPEVGQTVTFDASASIPSSGIIIRHKWSFGDGTYAIGKVVTHSYASPGVYTVTLNVTNSKGLWDIEQKQILVVELAPGPKPPVASFTYSPSNPMVDEEVTINASASFDPDGEIVSCNWDFGDGSTGEGKIATHSYSKEGNYKVTLTVVDNDGKSSSTSQTVTVIEPKTDERIEKAIAWALDKLGSTEYANKCLRFVWNAYELTGAKIPSLPYQYAKQAADALGAKDNLGAPPRGAYAFYDCNGTLDGEYRNWGHVGLSLGNGDVVHAFGKVRKDNYLDIQNLSPGVGWTNPQYIGWAYPPLTPPIKTKGLSVIATCPVDLVVIDPDYLVMSKEYSEIPEAVYMEEDFNGDGSPDDYVFISERKMGEYLITVIPEPDADPTATYTLEVSSEGITFLLAENVPISDIPPEPYVLDSTTFEAPPIVTANIDFDPDTLNIRSKGKWVTVYIELPEGYDVSQIDVSSIMLNSTVPALANPIEIGDYDSDSIPDLMVKFDRASVIALFNGKTIPGNYVMEVTGTLASIRFKGTVTIRVISSA